MKKVNLILIFILLGATAEGQSEQLRKLKIGVDVYANSSRSLTTRDDFLIVDSIWSRSETSKPSLSASVSIAYDLTKRINVSAGLGIQNTGYRQNVTNLFFEGSFQPSGNVDFSYNYTYVDVPLNVRVYLAEKLYINSGVSASFYIINSTKMKTNIESISNSKKQDFQTDYREINGTVNNLLFI